MPLILRRHHCLICLNNSKGVNGLNQRKINPRRRPASQADIERAKDSATEHAMRCALYMALYVLVDKHDATHEELSQLAREVNYLADSINRGYLSWQDIERTLEEEYNVRLNLK